MYVQVTNKVSNKEFTFRGEVFTACDHECHIRGVRMHLLIPCCDLCYSPYIIANLVMKDSTEIDPVDLTKENSHQFSHYGKKVLDESLLDEALLKAYNWRIQNRKERAARKLIDQQYPIRDD